MDAGIIFPHSRNPMDESGRACAYPLHFLADGYDRGSLLRSGGRPRPIRPGPFQLAGAEKMGAASHVRPNMDFRLSVAYPNPVASADKSHRFPLNTLVLVLLSTSPLRAPLAITASEISGEGLSGPMARSGGYSPGGMPGNLFNKEDKNQIELPCKWKDCVWTAGRDGARIRTGQEGGRLDE